MSEPNFQKGKSTGLTSMLLITLVCLTILFIDNNVNNINLKKVNGQLLSPPPPPPPTTDNYDTKIGNEKEVTQKSKLYPGQIHAPSIDLITKELKQGKNVIRISVTSDAPINYCKIKFFRDLNSAKIVDCVKDHGDVYKGLVDARPPYQKIELYARDIYGDGASSVKMLNVLPQPLIQDQLWGLLHGLVSGMRSIL